MRPARPNPSARRRASSLPSGVLILLLANVCSGCPSEDEERESERDTARGERARRSRALKAQEEFRRRWHAEYRQEIERATGSHTPAPLPPKSCEPWAELRQRALGPHHLANFAQAVGRLLSPSAATLVALDGRPHQLFRFALRMHPGEEPALDRGPARDELELDLRRVPLCSSGPVVMHTEILRLLVARRAPAGRTGLQLRLPGARLPALAPGEPIELLLDPTVSSLHRGNPSRPIAKRAGGSPDAPVGIWEITDARVPDRERLRRLELDTTAFGDRLRQIAAVEVTCRAPSGLCRFLTRTRKHREHPLELADLLRQAAPITQEVEARQLWTVLRALRYPQCSAGEHRPAGKRHPCLLPGGPSASEACQYWLALNGFPTRLTVLGGQKTFAVTQVLSCPGTRHQVLRVEASFTRDGDLRLRETDLTSRAADLDAEVLRMTR